MGEKVSEKTIDIILRQNSRLEKKIDALQMTVDEMKIQDAKRDSRLFLVMAIFGAIGGAVADFIKRKWIG